MSHDEILCNEWSEELYSDYYSDDDSRWHRNSLYMYNNSRTIGDLAQYVNYYFITSSSIDTAAICMSVKDLNCTHLMDMKKTTPLVS